jgi:MoaA/NifB/PqqE/SkfB family radical SAM enzyme
MTALRYDYLLHATVPAREEWGLSSFHAGIDTDAESQLSEEELVARLNRLRHSEVERQSFKRSNHALAMLEFQRMAVECRSRPYVVQISRTEKCNLSCGYCRPTRAHHSTRSFDFEPWEAALPLLLGPALEFMPFCWGEPLMAPDFELMCEHSRQHDVAVSFITNMLYLDPDLADSFVRGVTRALISIDTIDPEQFAQLRAGGSLNRLTHNLRMLTSAAQAAGVARPWLGVSAVLLPETLDGLPDLVRWAADQGLGGVSVRRVVLRDNIGSMHETHRTDLNSPSYRQTLDICRRLGGDLDVEINMADPDFCLGREAVCPCPWHHVYLSASGRLSKCSFSHKVDLGGVPRDDGYWNTEPFLRTRQGWTATFRCSECSSLDFIGRVEVAQVRGY